MAIRPQTLEQPYEISIPFPDVLRIGMGHSDVGGTRLVAIFGSAEAPRAVSVDLPRGMSGAEFASATIARADPSMRHVESPTRRVDARVPLVDDAQADLIRAWQRWEDDLTSSERFDAFQGEITTVASLWGVPRDDLNLFLGGLRQNGWSHDQALVEAKRRLNAS